MNQASKFLDLQQCHLQHKTFFQSLDEFGFHLITTEGCTHKKDSCILYKMNQIHLEEYGVYVLKDDKAS